MDLSNYPLEDLLLAAIKSEIESREVYATLADRVRNAFLKERLTFLASEEEKHRAFIEVIFNRTFPGAEIVLPEETPVPLPVLRIPDESVPLSEVFEHAKEAEKASSEFYRDLVDQVEGSDVKRTLLAFSAMEMDHYRILDAEQENIKRFEDFDVEWPMMNVGP